LSISERIGHELREIGLVSLYFLTCFLLFLSLKKLILAEYGIEVWVFHTALIGALVVAKVVVLLDKTSFGDRHRSGRVVFHVLWRSLAYTAVVFVVSGAERLFELYRETEKLPEALSQLWAGKDFHHFLAMNLGVALSFLLYNSFSEIDRRLGEGGLRKFFFERS
jgi:hypothetical protein